MEFWELEGYILGAVGFVMDKVGAAFTTTEWGVIAFGLLGFRALALMAGT
jgi:F0F1-type ATP synthase assembly protein I